MAQALTPGGDAPAPEMADLASHRDYLYRYAIVQLRDEARAEDVVQETLLAAMENRARFTGRAQLRTWLTGILKHKIIDVFRRQSRELTTDSPLPETAEDDDFADAYFDATQTDHWRTFPQTWADPERSFEQRRFWEVFDLCSQQMSAPMARVFIMREVMGLETEDICKELGITANNCWVMLYRARMSLRRCLEARWFGNPA